MFKKQDYLNHFRTKIVNFEEKEQFFLINVFREMFSSITPTYTINDVDYYKNIDLNRMISINGNNVSFMGYETEGELKKKIVTFANNGKIYVSNYELNPNGVFRKSVRRFPMEYDNIQKNSVEYLGYMNNASTIVSVPAWLQSFDKVIDQETIKGISSGKPVCMYSSHSYITIGKTDKGHFTYGVFNVAEKGDLDFKPFIMYEDEVISPEDARELNDILYCGRVPADKVIPDCEPNTSVMGDK